MQILIAESIKSRNDIQGIVTLNFSGETEKVFSYVQEKIPILYLQHGFANYIESNSHFDVLDDFEAIKNKIDIIIEKNLAANKNSIIKFSVPITKSTTISITKNEENKIVSKKIITKLYKKRVLSENIIKNNLYSSAVKAKINPDTIIEFARIFGFEIDFQRDIRKNDYFKIVYDKYFDENENI